MSDLDSLMKFKAVNSVTFIEDELGDWKIKVVYDSDRSGNVNEGYVHGHKDKVRVWKKIQTTSNFWKKNFPEFDVVFINYFKKRN